MTKIMICHSLRAAQINTCTQISMQMNFTHRAKGGIGELFSRYVFNMFYYFVDW